MRAVTRLTRGGCGSREDRAAEGEGVLKVPVALLSPHLPGTRE